MATLQDLLDEQARIAAELKRMENDESVTEEGDGDARDTLVERWQELDARTKPLIERMERVRGITRQAEDPASREAGTDMGRSGPEFMARHDPFEDLDAGRGGFVASKDLLSRAEAGGGGPAKRGPVIGDRAGTGAPRRGWSRCHTSCDA